LPGVRARVLGPEAARAPDRSAMRIQILLFDGFDELDALGAFEVLNAAAGLGTALRPELARLDRATVTSGFGLQLHVPACVDPEVPPALLIVPGADWLIEAEPGSWAERERARIGAGIAAVHSRGARLAAVGTATTLLGAAGLLRGRTIADDPRLAGPLPEFGAATVSERVADDGDLVSSGGIGSGVALALWLVRRFVTEAVADEVERRLGAGRQGAVWRREE
jgi:transcriptional regulator GlxA family with amidase domain